ncbi:3-oxoadipate enol-lactonase [Palleronia rufa]|uniref:3-oxoadipate enol-lactonase n=1 Tax=Palleronia rufa TaxID=1530186 RepID=UPI00056B3262|nr:3-oxoadipate enol-lactonase [Palleronia rufa]
MPVAHLNGIHLHYRDEGPRDGPAVVFSNSLGTDLHLWDSLLPHLRAGLRIVRYDTRGHGLSDAPPPPYAMGALVTDLERLCDHLDLRDTVLVGISLGGMTAQALAVKRLDLVRGLVLSNTGAKIGTPALWDDRIESVRTGGLAAQADATVARWFARHYRDGPDHIAYRHMFTRTPVDGYTGCSAAISGTDLMAATATLRLPALAIAGDEDDSTPPDMVRETAALIPGADFALIRRAGHLPFLEQPAAYADALNRFLDRINHV